MPETRLAHVGHLPQPSQLRLQARARHHRVVRPLLANESWPAGAHPTHPSRAIHVGPSVTLFSLAFHWEVIFSEIKPCWESYVLDDWSEGGVVEHGSEAPISEPCGVGTRILADKGLHLCCSSSSEGVFFFFLEGELA